MKVILRMTASHPAAAIANVIEKRWLTPCAVAAAVAREFGLSKREGQVLRAAARGRSIKEIAFQLRVSGRDVEYFWRRIFGKIGQSSQVRVIAFLLRRACQQRVAVGVRRG